MTTFCTTCETTLAPDAKFCANCGTGMATTPTPESSMLNPTPLAARVAVQTPTAQGGAGQALPAPPSLHWAIVLLLTVVTLGAFAWVWVFVQAIWVKRLTGTWKPLIWLSVPLSLVIVALIKNPDVSVPSSLGWLFVFGVFSVRRHVLRHYKSVEPINLQIGFWWTFLGTVFYLQYHFTRIARLKRDQPHLFAPYATPVGSVRNVR
ncbi:MAG: zinc-ribbon domain-containing protein [Candidatus Dormibacteraceae bacterium]